MSPAGIRLERVTPGGPAFRAGLTAGSRILAVDGHRVDDAIDLAYAVAEPEFAIEFLDPRGRRRRARVWRAAGRGWGASAEVPPVRRCGNRCVFCFVDQMPPGLRPALYVKDEDYRHSFLFGNYITLTRLPARDLERIHRLHLSPLFVSVHATDPRVRARMLGLPRAQILPALRALAAAGIEVHAQAVICPGWNDSRVLLRTVRDLAALYPSVKSLVLVPVGLTAHRRNLTPLRRPGREDARRLLKRLEDWQARYHRQFGVNWVYAADEWYLLAGRNVPPAEAYDGFPQLENGAGLVRRFLDAIRPGLLPAPARIRPPRRVLLVTGRLMVPVLRKLLAAWKAVPGLDVQVVGVSNRLFGKDVTVAGLLSGKDILDAVRPLAKPGGLLLLPPEPMRQEGRRFVDDVTPAVIARETGLRVRVVTRPERLPSMILNA